MRHSGLGWALLLSMVSLAGCGGGSGPQSASPTQDFTGTHGAIVGLVTDDESVPIDGAAIAIQAVKVSPIAIKIFTGPDGRFRMENVPSGRQTVVAEKDGYKPVTTTVTVVPDVENPVRFVMVKLPSTERSHTTLAAFVGSYTCGFEYFVASGPCDYEVKNHTGQDPIDDKNNHTLEIPPDWGGVLFEIKHTYGIPATGEGLRFQLESQEDLGGMFIRADVRASPVRIELNAGQVSPDATLGYPMPQRGIKTWMHVLPLGYFDGGTCAYQCGYGVGAAIQLNYEIHVTFFFGSQVEPEVGILTKGS